VGEVGDRVVGLLFEDERPIEIGVEFDSIRV
jgi:hypothetical protein